MRTIKGGISRTSGGIPLFNFAMLSKNLASPFSQIQFDEKLCCALNVGTLVSVIMAEMAWALGIDQGSNTSFMLDQQIRKIEENKFLIALIFARILRLCPKEVAC